MSSNKNDKELNIVKLVANMAEEKYANKMTPKTFSKAFISSRVDASSIEIPIT